MQNCTVYISDIKLKKINYMKESATQLQTPRSIILYSDAATETMATSTPSVMVSRRDT